MNEFFKFLIPQLLNYFSNNEEILLEFIPKTVIKNYQNEIKNLFVKKDINSYLVEK